LHNRKIKHSETIFPTCCDDTVDVDQEAKTDSVKVGEELTDVEVEENFSIIWNNDEC